jgi:hypothetical protein
LKEGKITEVIFMKAYFSNHIAVLGIAFLAGFLLTQLAAGAADCPDKGNRGCFPVDTVGGAQAEPPYRGSGR